MSKPKIEIVRNIIYVSAKAIGGVSMIFLGVLNIVGRGNVFGIPRMFFVGLGVIAIIAGYEILKGLNQHRMTVTGNHRIVLVPEKDLERMP